MDSAEEFDLESEIWDLLEEYTDHDGEKLYRAYYVDQCISEVTRMSFDLFGEELGMDEEEMEETVQRVWKIFCKMNQIPKNSYSSFMFSIKRYMSEAGYATTDAYKEDIHNKLQELDSLPQPEQRTPEWYEMRANVLTATAISKLFFSEARTNSVIFEKCSGSGAVKPLNISCTDPRHWGQKYEPITREIYETMYRTSVKEYGCIRHREHSFIAASPDGINVYPHSSRYGRLVEIKNIFNREITCEPSEEYWIQMQIQMEVTNLDICDFVETRIKEVAEEEYFSLTAAATMETKSYEFHGILLQFANPMNPQEFFYEYMPLFYTGVVPCVEKLEQWRNETIEKHQDKHVYVKTLYWVLDEISVVVVLRNKFWFEKALPEIRRVWTTIEKERITGYQHRKPKTVLPKIDDILT